MKKIVLSFLCVLTMSMFSCQDNLDFFETDTEQNFQYPVQPANIPIYSTNQLIVEYKPGILNPIKDTLRNHYNVRRHDTCLHCDETIERWEFKPGVILENKLGSIRDDVDPEGLIRKVEKEFEFYYEYEENILTGGSPDTSFESKIVPSNSGVTIAVLDSGFDANYFGIGSERFLYNGYDPDILEIKSGWDYVNQDNNCYDDYELVHGTAVAKIIHETLTGLGVPHQILPVKVANASGRASRFDILCAISFASDRADIINMSLGWYDIDGPDDLTNDIFYGLLEKYENDVLFVTSAGNRENDNDLDTEDNFPHYPSNYDTENMIAVAAANRAVTEMANFSNYGAYTVDFIAKGDSIPFNNMEGSYVPISGTSFAAPHASAVAAYVLIESGMEFSPAQIVNGLDISGIPFTTPGKPTKYGKLILPE